MEKGGSFYEMVDLGFGKCRFALATKKGKDVYGGYKTPVIATKYPAVTKAFFNKKNMDVETIKDRRLGRAGAAARAGGRHCGYRGDRHDAQVRTASRSLRM